MGKQASGMHFDVICSREVRATPVKSSGQASSCTEPRGLFFTAHTTQEAIKNALGIHVFENAGGVEDDTRRWRNYPSRRSSNKKIFQQETHRPGSQTARESFKRRIVQEEDGTRRKGSCRKFVYRKIVQKVDRI